MNPVGYICIHGHFYQPPRENPWLESIEVQDSARPYHDWNERILRECYAPNARARILSPNGHIARIVNNYESLSFNFGATLLSWMREYSPETYGRIVEADRNSRELRSGHGNALAQIYNHVIMPLANARDKKLQVHWGIEDFRFHFGREPEGMWLSECAVDTATLETLVDAGIRFSILAPRQADAIRPLGHDGHGYGDWQVVGEGIDPTRAYLCELPSGRTITLFFYDGPIARAVAFEGLLSSGENFADRLMTGFNEHRRHPQLMHIATDGESYGHHHTHGDMALAAALEVFRSRDIAITNYGEYLERHPPTHAVRIAENSSWSCAHGVERWRSNCGCGSHGNWTQAWRGPLRDTFNWLRDQMDDLFAHAGAELFFDPWQARMEYIRVILDRQPDTITSFCEHWLRHPARQTDRERALKLLEMQRHVQLMFTSCGWFFDEISGLEPVQNMKYAARSMQLAREFGRDLWDEAVQRLEVAPSNIPEFGTGAGSWRKYVEPAVVSPNSLVAQYAVLQQFEPDRRADNLYTFHCELLDRSVSESVQHSLSISHVRVSSKITTETAEAIAAVLHFGHHDVHCAVRPTATIGDFDGVKKTLLETYERSSLTGLIRKLDTLFGEGEFFSLGDLFLDDRRRVLHLATRENLERFRGVYTRLYEENRKLMGYSRQLNIPVPSAFCVAAEYALAERVSDLLDETAGRVPIPPRALGSLQDVFREVAEWKLSLPSDRFETTLQEVIEQHLIALHSDLRPDVLDAADKLFSFCESVNVDCDTWEIQNRFFEFLTNGHSPVHKIDQFPPADRERIREGLKRLAQRLDVDRALIRD